MLDDVQKIRMCVAEVGGDESAIDYPDEVQKARGCDFVYDSRLIDFKIVWQASQLVEKNKAEYVCWACISPYQDAMVEGVWEKVATRCEAYRPSTRDCGIDRVNS